MKVRDSMLRRAVTWFTVCSCFFLLATPDAAAQDRVRRYAVVIGNDTGAPDEDQLRYAESDAKRMADVLTRIGGVPEGNIMRLFDSRAAQVAATFNQMNARIARDKKLYPKDETLLFVFYSGHASERAMHLGSSRLAFKTLRRTMDASAADMRVLIIDACHSGELTRVKGGKPAKPFRIDLSEQSASEGLAIITSSTAGEKAQESDRIKGSYFTHYLITGMLGAADKSSDGVVSLAEAYRYAYDETLRATSKVRHVQHPTYAFDIRGRRDVMLTFLEQADAQNLGRMTFTDAGFYVLFERDESGRIVTELTAQPRTTVALPPGTYLVRHRKRGQVYESQVRIEARARESVEASSMRRVPQNRVVRKGGVEGVYRPHATIAATGGAIVSQPTIAQMPGMVLGVAGVQFDTTASTFQLRTRFGRVTQDKEFLLIQQQMLGFEGTWLKLFDIGALSAGPGLRFGADLIRQRFDTAGEAFPRRGVLWRAGPVLHAAYTPVSWFSLTAEIAADVAFTPIEDPNGELQWNSSIPIYGFLGVNLYVF